MTKRAIGQKGRDDRDRIRTDAGGTKASILEAAGQVFAEKGVGGATGKEIAQRAGVNSAAVNYYYGGIDGLYAEVLVEAHHRLLGYDRLLLLLEGPGSPVDKLRNLIEGLAGAVVRGNSSAWPLRVLSREIVMPSPASAILRERELLPKRKILVSLLCEFLGLPPDHPAVAWSCLSIIAPLVMLLIVDRAVPAQVLPQPGTGREGAEDLIRHFQCFAIGGLSAVAAQTAGGRTRKKSSR
jgi:AcrR family transcriptional regulator